MTVRSDARDLPDDPWEAVPEAGAERFLTLNGARAKQLGIAQRFATTRQEVIDSFPGGTNGQVKIYSHKISDSVAHVLNYPLVTGLILVIGLVALYFEVAAPGTMVGGLIGGLCAALFFWSHFAGGTAGWMEVILFVAGLAFIAAEIFVIPGFGVAGFGGIVLLTASVILASQGFVVPETAVDWDQFLSTLVMLVIAGFTFFIAAFFITSRMGSLPLFSRMVLSTDREGQSAPAASPTPQILPVEIGAVGVADSLLRPAGRASFDGRSFDVISDGSFVEAGVTVRVIKVFGNVITVSEVQDS
jgi:membrane-bound serine protease (ClpP class)